MNLTNNTANNERGSKVLHFPGDVSVVTTEDDSEKPPTVTEEYVTLPRAELEAMVTRDEVESLLKRQQDKMEVMMRNMLHASESSSPGQRFYQQAHNTFFDDEELVQLKPLSIEEKEQAQNEPAAAAAAAEDKDNNWHTPFGETVYTLLYMSSSTSQSFWYGVFIIAIQMTTILLTMVDRIDWDATENKLQIPAMVDPTVTTAQSVTILIALAYQSDLIEAVLKLQDGFYPEVMEKHPGATYATWLFSCLAQLLAGLLLLSTIFILTMQVGDVLSIMLNFAALHFMAEIDDLGFTIAKLGFLTNQLQREAHHVVDFQLPKRSRRNLWRRLLYFSTMIFLFTMFGFLKNFQAQGSYLPTYLYVQFGDAYNSKIPYYSGLMTSGNVRTAYHREYRDLGTENILLAWCPSERAWTFSDTNDPCDYFAKSYETKAYDVTSVHDSHWEIKDSLGRLQPFDSFTLMDRDCNPNTCQGTCNTKGLCECPHDRFGMDCEFSNVCSTIQVDDRFEGFPAAGSTQPHVVSEEFQLLQNDVTKEYVRVYNMPVYYSNNTYPADIIFFAGRRWIVTSEFDLFDLREAQRENPARWSFPEKTVATLQSDFFHGYYKAQYTPFYISEAVDFKTPDFRPTPIGLTWLSVRKRAGGLREFLPDVALSTIMRCKLEPMSCIGKQKGFCGSQGTCSNVTGLCECNGNSNFSGDRCQNIKPCYDQLWPCSGKGECDTNTGHCRCHDPYFGKLCEETQNCYEEGGSCRNGGVCNVITGNCTCPTDPAISGSACEQTTDCAVVGCENGGICGWNGNCICPPPYHGIHCHLSNATQTELFCAKHDDCINGSCNADTGICACNNPASYGTLCQFQYNCSATASWAGPPCANSGTCNSITGICDCPDPYFGHDCSKVPPCEMDNECGGPGIGSCNIDSGKCDCFGGTKAGKRCQLPIWCVTSTATYDCYNGGICNHVGVCECPYGYSGRLCEFWVAGMYDPRWDDTHRQHEEGIRTCGFEDPFCYMNDFVLDLPP